MFFLILSVVVYIYFLPRWGFFGMKLEVLIVTDSNFLKNVFLNRILFTAFSELTIIFSEIFDTLNCLIFRPDGDFH